MSFELKPLPYPMDALDPYISRLTLEFHYGKHHQGYVNKVNSLIEGTKFENASLEEIIKEADGGIFNNGAQVWNHTFYWESMAPGGKEMPDGNFKDAVKRDFSSVDEMIDKFTNVAAGLFGSGWTWLVKNDSGRLEIIPESNAGNPLRDGFTPLLVCDVWEHAYYLDKKNLRPDYISDFWKLVNWEAVAARY